MADRIAFAIFDASGQPVTNASPEFLNYVDRDGAQRAVVPTLSHLGGGLYGFLPSDEDVAIGCAYVIRTNGTNTPPWFCGTLCPDRAQFAVVLLDDGSALWAGAAPTLGQYLDVSTGADRTVHPDLQLIAGTYLYSLTPSAEDVALGTAWRIDSPVGASVPYYSGSFYNPVAGALPSTTTKRVENVAATALREWLLLSLPAKVAQVNSQRAAKLRAARAESYTVPANAVLKVSLVAKGGPFTNVPLTAGNRTATQIAADVENVLTGIATADTDGRLLIASSSAPIAGTPSVVAIGPDSTGANAVFGFDPGGECVINYPLEAPTYRGVSDGWPLWPDLGAGFWVIIGDRRSKPVPPSPRRYEYLVGLELAILNRAPPTELARTRESINACVQCVREVLLTSRGRRFGAPESTGAMAIVYSEEQDAMVAGRPFSFNVANTANPHFDVASMKLVAKVYERPGT